MFRSCLHDVSWDHLLSTIWNSMRRLRFRRQGQNTLDEVPVWWGSDFLCSAFRFSCPGPGSEAFGCAGNGGPFWPNRTACWAKQQRLYSGRSYTHMHHWKCFMVQVTDVLLFGRKHHAPKMSQDVTPIFSWCIPLERPMRNWAFWWVASLPARF